MSFGRPAASQAAWTSQQAGAFTQQIAKDERMARRALDVKLAKLEAEEGEVRRLSLMRLAAHPRTC